MLRHLIVSNFIITIPSYSTSSNFGIIDSTVKMEAFKMNLLFSISDNFTEPLLTTLFSIRNNTKEESYVVYVLQKEELKDNKLIHKFCQQLQMEYKPIIIGKNIFQNAPASERWPESIYYRLLAHEFLPSDLDKILYLDADVLCINDLSLLYNQNINDYLYAASSHTRLEVTDTINRLRLGNRELKSYFNSGVLLMNLTLIRQEVKSETIYNFIMENHDFLLMPDQDVLNGLYGDQILPLPDELYNFDSRLPFLYEIMSQKEISYDWIMDNTVILHFCGKNKPWNESERSKFSVLYKHYYSQMKRVTNKITSK